MQAFEEFDNRTYMKHTNKKPKTWLVRHVNIMKRMSSFADRAVQEAGRAGRNTATVVSK
jgi:hypothetical protein